ncbi:hypothetical protein [Flavobacterium sp.]|jgi:hypothetical protein|uniref:hypothetical protein n=1 Tax=Flavobacterium sp. TaxID=239 RepID=UPI0037C17CDE
MKVFSFPAIATACLLLFSLEAKAVSWSETVNVTGTNYSFNLTTVTGSYQEYASLLSAQPWFNQGEFGYLLAGELANATADDVGYLNFFDFDLSYETGQSYAYGDNGPVFVMGADGTGLGAAVYNSGGYKYNYNTSLTSINTFAIVSEVPEINGALAGQFAVLTGGLMVAMRRRKQAVTEDPNAKNSIH